MVISHPGNPFFTTRSIVNEASFTRGSVAPTERSLRFALSRNAVNFSSVMLLGVRPEPFSNLKEEEGFGVFHTFSRPVGTADDSLWESFLVTGALSATVCVGEDCISRAIPDGTHPEFLCISSIGTLSVSPFADTSTGTVIDGWSELVPCIASSSLFGTTPSCVFGPITGVSISGSIFCTCSVSEEVEGTTFFGISSIFCMDVSCAQPETGLIASAFERDFGTVVFLTIPRRGGHPFTWEGLVGYLAKPFI